MKVSQRMTVTVDGAMVHQSERSVSMEEAVPAAVGFSNWSANYVQHELLSCRVLDHAHRVRGSHVEVHMSWKLGSVHGAGPSPIETANVEPDNDHDGMG